MRCVLCVCCYTPSSTQSRLFQFIVVISSFFSLSLFFFVLEIFAPLLLRLIHMRNKCPFGSFSRLFFAILYFVCSPRIFTATKLLYYCLCEQQNSTTRFLINYLQCEIRFRGKETLTHTKVLKKKTVLQIVRGPSCCLCICREHWITGYIDCTLCIKKSCVCDTTMTKTRVLFNFV